MSRIQLVTASAGTGKTYYLTNLVYEAIRSGEVAPGELLVTTFTRRAAAELQQRCRRRLLAAGNAAEAHRLAAARIGTVHSICGRLVTDFAFELGMSPDVRVLDEALAAKTLRRSLSKVVTSQEQEELAKLKHRMPELDWDDFVERIVEAARNNGLSAEELGESREKSLATAVQLLGPPASDGAELDHRLCAALESMIDGVDRASDATKATAAAVERAERDLRTLQRGERLSWRDWASLASLKTGKQSGRLVEPVHHAAAVHDVHPALHDDVRRSIELVFSIAARAYEAYQERKREWGVIDFADQEALSLQLLRMDSVREQLATEIRRVFIDEFQDTSPLQLAIFLKLAEMAELSVWVGDRKQAIFGFRGTDPALMSAAVAKLGRDDSEPKEPELSLAGTDPALIDDAVRSLDDDLVEVLDKNWRSRPPLVGLTSDLFAVGFAPHGFSEREVRCSAAVAEPAGLGPTVEYWELDLENRARRTEYPRALAVAVDELLRDPGALVRDRATGSVRRVIPGDIAILCRRHVTARRVATALGEQGVRTALPRPGLCNTPEVRAAVAGLRLWIDPSERLARAELARVLLDPEKVNLLEEVIRAKASHESVRVPALERVEQVRAECGDAGPLEALCRVIEGLGLRERCRCWGASDQRLANLDALRALIARHVAACATERIACTVASCLAHIEEAVANEEDGRAVVASDAVIISTWHAAKGLEWPITILFDLDWPQNRYDWGVRVGFGTADFDLSNPLGGRWIRCWPTPYQWNQTQPPFYARLQCHPAAVRAVEENRKEQLRLLYVGWTRARDRVVLAAPRGRLTQGILGELRGVDGPLITDPSGRPAIWAGREVEVVVRRAMPREPVMLEPVADDGYPIRESKDYPVQVIRPSGVVGSATQAAVETIGAATELQSGADPVALGKAIHGFLAADHESLSTEARSAIAARVIRAWGLVRAIEPSALLALGDALAGWIAARWPGREVLREVPLESRSTDGSRVRGVADCVVDAAEGWVIIDHKVLRGAEGPAEAAQVFAGQLGSYASVLEHATTRAVASRYIHLPLSGTVIRVD